MVKIIDLVGYFHCSWIFMGERVLVNVAFIILEEDSQGQVPIFPWLLLMAIFCPTRNVITS